ncbi:guanine permease, partial [Campylobacter sp. 4]
MDFFKLKENNTSFKAEVIAGLTTFLAMVYIIPVNSSIVGNTGMPIEALITAT